MVLNTMQQLLHNQDDKNHKTEYVITYISSTAYNLHDLYNLWDPINSIYMNLT